MNHTSAFYYSVLLWAAILYGAGVAFKFGSIFLYEAFMPWVSDTPVQRPPKPFLSPVDRLLWWFLGGYLILSGILQIPPLVAIASPATLRHMPLIRSQSGLGHALVMAFYHGWIIHPMMYNILVFMIEAVLGLFIMTERGTLLGRITAVVTVIWGIGVWILPEGLGMLFSTRSSWWANGPGSGLILALLGWLLLLKMDAAKKKRLISWGYSVAFGIGTLWQLTFFNAHRLANAFQVGPHVSEPKFVVDVMRTAHHLALRDALILNLVLVLLTAVLAIAPLLLRRLRLSIWLFTVILVALWWCGQDFGLDAQFSLMLNTAPLFGIALWALYVPDQSSVSPL